MRKFIILLLLLGLPFLVKAQADDSLDVGVKVTIQEVFDLSLVEVYDYDANATGNAVSSADDTVDYGTLTPGDYTVGSTQGTYAVRLQVSSNAGVTWYVKTRATGDFVDAGGTNTFPCDSLKWSLDGDPATQTWTNYTTTYATVTSGTDGVTDIYVDYRLVIAWTFTPSTDYKTLTRYLLTTTP